MSQPGVRHLQDILQDGGGGGGDVRRHRQPADHEQQVQDGAAGHGGDQLPGGRGRQRGDRRGGERRVLFVLGLLGVTLIRNKNCQFHAFSHD